MLFEEKKLKVFIFILTIISFFGCGPAKVVSDNQGIITIKGPRVAWGPGHNTYTSEAQKNADEYCKKNGRDRAHFISGEVKLFDGDYNSFTCTVKNEKIMEIPKVKKSLSNISKCIRQNIVALDDLSSDAKTIAEGIASICSPTINKFLVEFLNEKKGNSVFNREFKINFKKQQYSKILPFVLKWRLIVRQGWNNKQIPTKKDLPDSLLKI